MDKLPGGGHLTPNAAVKDATLEVSSGIGRKVSMLNGERDTNGEKGGQGGRGSIGLIGDDVPLIDAARHQSQYPMP